MPDQVEAIQPQTVGKILHEFHVLGYLLFFSHLLTPPESGKVRHVYPIVFTQWLHTFQPPAGAIATAVNILVGFWFLMSLPSETLGRFMGQSLFASLVLAAGIILAFGAMIMMFLVLNAADPAPLVRGSLGTLALTLIFMVLTRDEVRRAALERAGFQAVPWVEPQWGNIGIFLVLLVAAIVTVIWMAVAFARSRTPVGGEGA